MKIVQKYGLIFPIILLQVTANVWGMDNKEESFIENIIDKANGLSTDKINKHYHTLTQKEKALSEIPLVNNKEEPTYIFPTPYNHIAGFHKKFIVEDEGDKYEKFKKTIVKQAITTIPVFSDPTFEKIFLDLDYRKDHGSTLEKKLYAHMSVPDFVFRLYDKALLACYNKEHKCVIFDEESKCYKIYPTALKNLELVGTDEEKYPFSISNTLTMSEAELASELGILGYSLIINNGNRQNRGAYSNKDDFQKEAVFLRLVGETFENPNYSGPVEFIDPSNKQDDDILITDNNIHHNKKDLHYEGLYFRPSADLARMQNLITNSLMTINDLGCERDKKIYFHAIGLGLGVWQLFDNEKEDIQFINYLKAFKLFLEDPNSDFDHISDIDFSWLSPQQKFVDRICEKSGLSNGQEFSGKNGNKLKIHFSKRNPTAKLTGEHSDKLLVVMVPGDSKSQPGNEYWTGGLSESGEPAAACSSLVPVLHSTKINNLYGKNIKKFAELALARFHSRYDSETLKAKKANYFAAQKARELLVENRKKAREEKIQRFILQKRQDAEEEAAFLRAEEKRIAAEQALKDANQAEVARKQAEAAEQQRQIKQAQEKERQEKLTADMAKKIIENARAELKKESEAGIKTTDEANANKQTRIGKIFSYGPVKAIAALGAFAAFYHFLVAAEHKDVITSTLTHCWEKLSSYIPTSARFS